MGALWQVKSTVGRVWRGEFLPQRTEHVGGRSPSVLNSPAVAVLWRQRQEAVGLPKSWVTTKPDKETGGHSHHMGRRGRWHSELLTERKRPWSLRVTAMGSGQEHSWICVTGKTMVLMRRNMPWMAARDRRGLPLSPRLHIVREVKPSTSIGHEPRLTESSGQPCPLCNGRTSLSFVCHLPPTSPLEGEPHESEKSYHQIYHQVPELIVPHGKVIRWMTYFPVLLQTFIILCGFTDIWEGKGKQVRHHISYQETPQNSYPGVREGEGALCSCSAGRRLWSHPAWHTPPHHTGNTYNLGGDV